MAAMRSATSKFRERHARQGRIPAQPGLERASSPAAVRHDAARCACGGGCPRCNPAAIATAGRGADGQPLDEALRADMESRFNTDFSGVRIHTSEKAGEAARALNARAYSMGRDIVFGPGGYAPHSRSGRALLSHELAHVVQSKGKPSAELSDPHSSAEREADGVARDYRSGHPLRRVRESARGIQRAPLGSSDISQSVSETISNAPATYAAWNGTYSWTSRFGIVMSTAPDVLTVVMRLHTTADPAVQSAWESAIESKWGGRFFLAVTDDMGAVSCFAIGVDVQWVDDPANAHYTITPNAAGATSGGRAGLGGTTSMTDWGTADTVDVTHEFGHMMGNAEEYFTTNGVDFTQGGARRGFRDPGGGVMNNPTENPEPRHYESVRLEAATLLGVSATGCTVTAVCVPRSAAGDYPLPSGDTAYA